MSVSATCPVCRASGARKFGRYRDEEYFTSTREFDYRQCGACGSLFIDPMPVDSLAEIYPANYYSFAGGKPSPIERVKHWLDRAFLRRVLRGLPGRELSVLDVGGGTGWLLDIAREADSRVQRTHVVDLDRSAQKLCSERGHQFFLGRIEDFVASEPFDAVLMLNIIEHVEDPARVLSQVAGLVRPGGVVIVKTPNCAAVDARLMREPYWGGLHVPRHWVLFTRESLHSVAAAAGLEVQSSRRTQAAPFWAFSALAWLRRRRLVLLSADRPAVRHPLYPLLAALFAVVDYLRMPFMETGQMQLVLFRPLEQRSSAPLENEATAQDVEERRIAQDGGSLGD